MQSSAPQTLVFFFFQAEDGIRDLTVTGVQTCALPISRWELDGRDVAFALGGAEALPAAVLQTADRTWSLSRLTFPHELARVIVYERSEEHTSELQSQSNLVCRLLLEKKK